MEIFAEIRQGNLFEFNLLFIPEFLAWESSGSWESKAEGKVSANHLSMGGNSTIFEKQYGLPAGWSVLESLQISRKRVRYSYFWSWPNYLQGCSCWCPCQCKMLRQPSYEAVICVAWMRPVFRCGLVTWLVLSGIPFPLLSSLDIAQAISGGRAFDLKYQDFLESSSVLLQFGRYEPLFSSNTPGPRVQPQMPTS